jgi:hypothetical protein
MDGEITKKVIKITKQCLMNSRIEVARFKMLKWMSIKVIDTQKYMKELNVLGYKNNNNMIQEELDDKFDSLILEAQIRGEILE